MFINHWLHKTLRGVSILELNSPSNRNALSIKLLEELQETIQSIKVDPKIRVVVLQAKNPSTSTLTPVFCSGHDLKELKSYQKQLEGTTKLEHLFELCSQVMTSIATSKKPIIAKVDGIATAAGCQLVASCDLAYATKASRFATPGVNIGLFCSTPAVALGRTVLSRKHAMEMLLTGDFVSAQRAQEIGLINQAFDTSEELDAHVDVIADTIASKPAKVIANGKQGFELQMASPSLVAAYEVASQDMVDSCLKGNCREGIDAFLQKRAPKWADD